MSERNARSPPASTGDDLAGSLAVHRGGGTAGVAVIARGAIEVGRSSRRGGYERDEAILRRIRQGRNLPIGERTAEEIKIKVGSARRLERELTMEIRGRDMITGLPKIVRITGAEIRETLAEQVGGILEAAKAVLEQTPPALAALLSAHGIIRSR